MKKNLIAALVAAMSAASVLAVQLPPAPGEKPADRPAAAAKPAAKTAPKPSDKFDLVKKAAEQPLPGLGVMPGEKQLTRANVVRVQSDRNEVVYVSASLANRIATPFDAPRVIDTSDVEFQTVGQSIFLVPKDGERPVALYVTGSNPNDPVVSLTLVPKAIPQQTIVLQLDAPLAKGASQDAEPAPMTDVYTDRIRHLLRAVALNKVPEGFVEGALPASTAVLPQVLVRPVARYSGPAYDIYRYTVTGRTSQEVELTEEAFYSEGVRAVAFFPTGVVRAGESTTVFVLADKSATGN